MRIDRLEILPVAIPLDHPYRDATRLETHSRDVLVRLTTSDGAVGWGAATPRLFPTGETQVGTVHVLEAVLADAVAGASIADVGAIAALGRAMDAAIPGHHAAKAAIDIAAHDALGRARGLPVHALLGERQRADAATLDILPLEPPERMAAIALGLHERLGTAAFKVKIDRDVAAGVARVAAIHAALPNASLVVDANGAWDVATSLDAAERLAPFGLRVIEQPVPGHDLDGLREVTQRSPVPIGADESVQPVFVDRLIATRAAHVVNVKLTREGGFAAALDVARRATAAGMDVVCGSVVQDGLVDAACAHLLAVLPELAWNEAGKSPGWHPRDVVHGLRVEAGRLHVPEGPGLGVEVDEDAVRAFRPRD